jgi:hypothetical protein
MKLETFRYHSESGWSIPSFPHLDSERTLVLVFGSSDFVDHPEPIQELCRAFSTSVVIGCSSSGEIHQTMISDGTLSVAVAQFERSEVTRASASIPQASESFSAGATLARALLHPDLRGAMILSDGLGVNGTALVDGLNSVFPKEVVVTGGLAGDGARFQRTWVLVNGKTVDRTVVAVGFRGQALRIGHGSKGGWDNFGPERLVTKSKGNVLFEVDGRPALQLYKEYLGERASGLPATGLLFPLAIRPPDRSNKRLVRTILAIHEETQSMTFAGDVPEGWSAQLMKANFDRLIGGASDAAEMSRTSRGSSHAETKTLAVAISCVGRRLVLGERSEEEVEATLDVLPRGTQQIGFYSYGEISPYVSGPCDLHNQTMTLTTISEQLDQAA